MERSGEMKKKKFFFFDSRAGTVEQDHENPSDELDSMDREEKLEHFSGIISECLGLLQKLGEAVEVRGGDFFFFLHIIK